MRGSPEGRLFSRVQEICEHMERRFYPDVFTEDFRYNADHDRTSGHISRVLVWDCPMPDLPREWGR